MINSKIPSEQLAQRKYNNFTRSLHCVRCLTWIYAVHRRTGQGRKLDPKSGGLPLFLPFLPLPLLSLPSLSLSSLPLEVGPLKSS